MEGWMDGRTDGGICRLNEWAGCWSDYRRIPQDYRMLPPDAAGYLYRCMYV